MPISISGNGTMGTMASGGITGGATLTAGTAQASTSGTSIDFTGIPSWVKRITVMFSGVSTNGSSYLLIQIGNGSVVTTGYSSASRESTVTTTGIGSFTTGFGIMSGAPTNINYGNLVLTLTSTNLWVSSHSIGFIQGSGGYNCAGGGSITLGGALDRIRITTVNGTDTFDAGSINILYE